MAAAVTTRIAVGLSGGVDSSVTALFLHRCVKTEADLRALWGDARWSPAVGCADNFPRAPSVDVLQTAVKEAVPWSEVILSAPPPSASSQPTLDSLVRWRQRRVEVVPVYMRNWDDIGNEQRQHGWCEQAERDLYDATVLCQDIGLLSSAQSLPVIHLAPRYVDRCFEPMLAAYAAGRTLNVDVLCNAEIKFGALLERITEPSSAAPRPCTYLATGHYARTSMVVASNETNSAVPSPSSSSSSTATPRSTIVLARPLSAAVDLNDQTHFLSRIRQSALHQAVFPLGHLFQRKADARALAEASALISPHLARVISRKKTSTGLCFVGETHSRPTPSKHSGHREGAGLGRACQYNPCGVSQTTASRERGSLSCSMSFARFLSDYLPPPPTASITAPLRGSGDGGGGAPMPTATTCVRGWDSLSPVSMRTRFVHAATGAVISAGGFRWDAEVVRDYPSYLPAFALTIGQRLRFYGPLLSSSSPTSSSVGVSHHAELLYVQKKVLMRAGSEALPSASPTPSPALLEEVRLVSRWDDPLLFSHVAHLHQLRLLIPLSLFQSLSEADQHSRNAFRLRCRVTTRHQAALTPAWLTWTGTWSAVEEGKAAARVLFDEPVRALTPGQVAVAYIALRSVREAIPDGMHTVQPSELCVVASGWIGEEDATS